MPLPASFHRVPGVGDLLLYPDEFPGGGVDRHRQLGPFATGTVDHVPGQLAGVVIPVQGVNDWRVGRLLQNLVAAVLLRRRQSLVRIDLQERHVKHLRR